MKALVKAEAKPGIWLQEMPKPEYSANEVLIKIEKTAICGTDIHIYNWDQWAQKTIPVPMIIGHEFYGKIVALGSQVKNLKVGDRVSGEGHIVCGTCRKCREGDKYLCPKTIGTGVNQNGAFAEYLVMPAENVWPIPEQISDLEASIFDPFGNAMHCVLSFDVAGESVLVTGAGPIGIMACAILKFLGAKNIVITDINEYRLALARQMGATLAINVAKENLAELMKKNNIENFGVGLEMSGNAAAFNDMIKNMQSGGKIALLGIPPNDTLIDWNIVIFKGLLIQGIYGRKMFSTWYKMNALLESGLNIKPVITHTYKVDNYLEAFELMSKGQSGKVILDWTQ